MKIAILVGTRPEIIKMAPVIRECRKRKLDYFVIHSKQHSRRNSTGSSSRNSLFPRRNTI